MVLAENIRAAVAFRLAIPAAAVSARKLMSVEGRGGQTLPLGLCMRALNALKNEEKPQYIRIDSLEQIADVLGHRTHELLNPAFDPRKAGAVPPAVNQDQLRLVVREEIGKFAAALKAGRIESVANETPTPLGGDGRRAADNRLPGERAGSRAKPRVHRGKM